MESIEAYQVMIDRREETGSNSGARVVQWAQDFPPMVTISFFEIGRDPLVWPD